MLSNTLLVVILAEVPLFHLQLAPCTLGILQDCRVVSIWFVSAAVWDWRCSVNYSRSREYSSLLVCMLNTQDLLVVYCNTETQAGYGS